jgi:SAM-dependent methyltransferase
MSDAVCQACGSAGPEIFYRQDQVPANSCLLLSTREEAVGFPTGAIHLGFCQVCGFIGNVAFDPSLAEYSERYEETQAFSKHFVEFARGLAGSWVEKYDLAGKHVVEIGCGKGEFLVMMAEAGIGSGTGIDPGVNPARIDSPAADRISWNRGLFDDEYGPLDADAVVCRHTLEHIPDVRTFLTRIRSAIGTRKDTVLLFELPDALRVLEEAAFWDVYYEHCSYFSAGSLARLFESCGFRVLDLALAYDDQYLILEARPDDGIVSEAVDDIARLRTGIDTFTSGYAAMADSWNERLKAVAVRGGKSVIWGASSKGVSFLAAAGEHVEAAVDINPHKHGTFMAGTGHPVIAPRDLVDISPDLVVVMNPVYLDEIGNDLKELGLSSEVVAV